MEIKFSDYKEKILSALNERVGLHGITEPTTLLEGFTSPAIAPAITENFVIGGPTLPMIILLGNSSGRIYFFSLKILVPEINLTSDAGEK